MAGEDRPLAETELGGIEEPPVSTEEGGFEEDLDNKLTLDEY